MSGAGVFPTANREPTDVEAVARVLGGGRLWKEGPLAYAFWAMNVGLGLMVVMSLLPIGLSQAWASVEHGLWYARSAEFLQQPPLQTLRWLRIFGDVVFLSGVAALAWFMLGLLTGHSYEPAAEAVPSRGRTVPEPKPVRA